MRLLSRGTRPLSKLSAQPALAREEVFTRPTMFTTGRTGGASHTFSMGSTPKLVIATCFTRPAATSSCRYSAASTYCLDLHDSAIAPELAAVSLRQGAIVCNPS